MQNVTSKLVEEIYKTLDKAEHEMQRKVYFLFEPLLENPDRPTHKELQELRTEILKIIGG